MSTNFWDAKVGDEETPTPPLPSVEQDPPSVGNKATKPHSDAVLFSNPLVIDVDGNKTQFPLARSNELSEQAINLIFKSKEYWMIELAPGNRFFQMNVQTAEIEHWLDGNIIHQQRGDIGQAMDYLESIIPEAIPSEKANASDNIWSQPTANNEISTSQRIVEMRSKDIQQLEQSGPKETHHFPNIAAIIVGGGALFFALISLINGAILPLLLLGFVSFIGLAIAFSMHTKIDHYVNDSTFVWYKGQSVDFIYQKQVGDKIQHWEEVSYSTDSEGNSTSTTHYHFRIIDSSGGELYSRGSLGHNNRAKLTNLLGLPTGNVSRSAGKVNYHDPGSPNFNAETANNSSRVLRTVALFPVIIFLMFGFVIVSDIFMWDDFDEWDDYDEDDSNIVYYCSNDGADYAYQMGGELCPEGYGITPDCPNGEPCICIDVDYDCFDGDDDWGYIIDFQYDSADRWCNNAENYPVTTPIEIVSVTEIGSNEENLAMWPNNDLSYAINGGVCDYIYHSSQSTSFEFVFNLVNTSDIDGISILYIDDEWYTSGYSGIEIYTAGVNNTEWIKRYSSEKMYGEYERYATYEEPAADFGLTAWYRHAFNETVTNVSQVKIVTGMADQMSDTSVSFTGLRVDAAGDYNYSDYFLCNGTWDGQFENSTSELILWDDLPRPYHLGCTDMVAQEE